MSAKVIIPEQWLSLMVDFGLKRNIDKILKFLYTVGAVVVVISNLNYGVIIMKLEFYYDKRKSDIEEVSKLTKKLQKLKKKNMQLKIIDISNMPKDEVYKIYANAWGPSVYKKYKIRHVFGSHRQSGIFFGKKPALLVYESDGEYPTDVFPHDIHGKVITIENFLMTIK